VSIRTKTEKRLTEVIVGTWYKNMYYDES